MRARNHTITFEEHQDKLTEYEAFLKREESALLLPPSWLTLHTLLQSHIIKVAPGATRIKDQTTLVDKTRNQTDQAF